MEENVVHTLRVLKSSFHNEKVLIAGKNEIMKFIKGLPNELSVYQQWMLHKYQHSIKVLRTGIELINREPELKSAPDFVKKEWMDALLMHDWGRADEISLDGKKILKVPHGTFGVQKLIEDGVTALNVLLPVFMHDQYDSKVLNYSDEKFVDFPFYKNSTDEMRQNLLYLKHRYQTSSPEDRKYIDLGCDLVRDADKLSNLREFQKMLNLSFCQKVPEFSADVVAELKQGKLVDYKKLRTYPDEALAYMAWSYDFNFASTKNELKKNRTLWKIADFTVSEVQKEFPGRDLTEFAVTMQKMADYVTRLNVYNERKILKVNRDEDNQAIQSYLYRKQYSR